MVVDAAMTVETRLFVCAKVGLSATCIVDALRDALPAAYNASFDRRFLHAELSRAGYQDDNPPPGIRQKIAWLDPLVMAREIYKGRGESRALGAVAERLGIPLDNAHRATDDAEAALRVLYAFAEDPRIPKTYASLIQEQRRLERQPAGQSRRLPNRPRRYAQYSSVSSEAMKAAT